MSWSAFKISTHADDKTKIEVKPIVRNDNNLSDYQNSSIDFSIRRSIGKKWYAQHLFRHWFIPEGPRRNFIWFDVGYVTPIGNTRLSSGTALRLHWALDTGGQNLADFLRIKQTFRFFNNNKFTPTIAVEGWYRYSDHSDFALYRIEPGFIWKISKN